MNTLHKNEQQYLNLIQKIKNEGIDSEDRTGTGTKRLIGAQMRFDLSNGYFPLLTTKKTNFSLIRSELIWFLKGDTNIKFLLENNNHIWDEWPYQRYIESNNLEDEYPKHSEKWIEKKKWFCTQILTDENFAKQWGDIGPIYGAQWRKWKTSNGEIIDQLKKAIETLRILPEERSVIISAWNPENVPDRTKNFKQNYDEGKSLLPSCHNFFQLSIVNKKLYCHLYQRSADMFLGVPFNIASYSLLTAMIAQVIDVEMGEFIHTINDAHIYKNHTEQIDEQLSREIKNPPKLSLNKKIKNIDDFRIEDIEIEDYDHHPFIKAPIAI